MGWSKRTRKDACVSSQRWRRVSSCWAAALAESSALGCAPALRFSATETDYRQAVRRLLYAPAQHRLFHLGDRLGDLDAAWARLGAVEGGAAAPGALFVVQDVEPHVAGVVARVEDEAVRVDDGGRPEVLPVGPEHGARRGACRAENALGGVVEDLSVDDRLDALLALGGRGVGDEERLHFA